VRERDAEGARRALRAAISSGPFGQAARAALTLETLASTAAEKAEALGALADATPAARGRELTDVLVARVRLAAVLHDSAARRSAAGVLLARVPALLSSVNLEAELARAAREVLDEASAAEKLDIARRTYDQGEVAAAFRLAAGIRPSVLSLSQGAGLALLRARCLARLRKIDESDRAAASVPRDGSPEDFRARLQEIENATARILHPAPAPRRRRRRRRPPARPKSDRDMPPEQAASIAQRLEPLSVDASPPDVRRLAIARSMHFWHLAGRRDQELAMARRLVEIDPRAIAGFEDLWKDAWNLYLTGDFAGALAQMRELEPLYREVSPRRRLRYWEARSMEKRGQASDARAILSELSSGDPPDVYAVFASGAHPRRVASGSVEELEETAVFSRVDELLRLRLYREALDEADALPDSRGRSLRLAAARFALGDFLVATGLVKAAYPQVGTVEEGAVPEQWRRLYYPIDDAGRVEAAARELAVDRNLLLALVRQESVFNAMAKSSAGAAGLTQLMPSTARRLTKKVLHKRFKTAFLYDPGINVRLGASYLKSLLDLYHGDTVAAVAAYNAGPGRVAEARRSAAPDRDDELLENLPAFETRDYVRKVLLYAESYRELYPETGR
jgi:soluble lytic murein transglycosylase-like protein